MLKLYFYFLKFLPKIQSCEKSVKFKSSLGRITKTNKKCNLFLAILCQGQDFLRKLPKFVVFRNACLVYLLNFGTQFSTSLKYLFWQMK